MRFAPILLLIFLRVWPVAATILQNGQPREDPYPGQQSPIKLDDSWRNYDAGVPEIAYKGRWDSQHISCESTSSGKYLNLSSWWLIQDQGGRGSFCSFREKWHAPDSRSLTLCLSAHRAPGIKVEFSGNKVRFQSSPRPTVPTVEERQKKG